MLWTIGKYLAAFIAGGGLGWFLKARGVKQAIADVEAGIGEVKKL